MSSASRLGYFSVLTHRYHHTLFVSWRGRDDDGTASRVRAQMQSCSGRRYLQGIIGFSRTAGTQLYWFWHSRHLVDLAGCLAVGQNKTGFWTPHARCGIILFSLAPPRFPPKHRHHGHAFRLLDDPFEHSTRCFSSATRVGFPRIRVLCSSLVQASDGS